MSNITAITNNDSDIYTGPGESYESIDHIVAGETVTVLSDEGDWCYIECPAGSLSFSTESLCGYVPSSVLDIISDGNESGGEDTGSTGTPHTACETVGYYGPDSSSYDRCTTLPESQIVTVLWEEGDYYYVEFIHDNYGIEMRAYVAKDNIEGLDDIPATYTESYSEVVLANNTMGYTGPGEQYAESGEVTTDWAVSKLVGKEENSFVFIEHPGSGNKYMRVWINESAIGNPDPDPVDPEPVDPEPDTPTTPDYVAYTTEDADTYFGPNGAVHDYCDHLSEGTEVTVLWKEGEYYYVEPTYSNNYKCRMYIDQYYLSDFTGEVENCSTMTGNTVNIKETVTCYTGPGADYATAGTAYSGTTGFHLGNKIENGFAFVEKIGDEKDSKCVWISVSALKGSSIPEPVPDLVTTTLDDTDTYYGPDAAAYDYCDHLPAGENITILWKEGDYYYIEALVSVYNVDENYIETITTGTKRMYIHKDYVGSFTGNVEDKTNAQHVTVVIASDTSVVSGPAVVYEPIEYLDADMVVTQLSVGEENSCAFIEYTANNGLKKRGWVPATAVREATSDETSIDNLVVAAGTVRTVDGDENPVSVKFMWGPEGVRKTIYKEGNTIAGSTSVDILWQEGDFYYVRYKVKVEGIDKYRCIYLKTGDVNITNESNTSVIPARVMDTSPDSYRYAKQDIDLYYYPVGGAEKAGSLSRLETMRKLGVTIGDYTLVEYDTGHKNYDKSKGDDKDGLYAIRKRAWINKTNIDYMPKPGSEVHLDTRLYLSDDDQADNAKYLYDYLIALGFEEKPACAVLGNIMAECTMNPGSWQSMDKWKDGLTEVYNLGLGYGLFQFTPTTKYLNRALQDGLIAEVNAKAINDYANGIQSNGLPSVNNTENLIQSQLECMIYGCFAGGEWCEPSGKFKNTEHYLPKIYDFMKAESVLGFDVDVLAIIFHDHFERSNDFKYLHVYTDANGNDIDLGIDVPEWDDVKTSRRVLEAQKFYKKFASPKNE